MTLPLPQIPLSQIRVWIFDLDNTLYPASCNLFAQVDRRIGEFIARHFGIPHDEARAMQKRFFREHGTTLRGLMVEHDVDPEPFLDYVHAIDVTPVEPSPRLDKALERLPGRKVIYTNGSVTHAGNVTARLGIARHFDTVFGIVEAGYVPKPDPRPYATLVERHGIDPKRACMVEDIARNLAPAHAMGMTTVWVRSEADWARPDLGASGGGVGTGGHIDHVADDLIAWLEAVPAA
ncbi:pyrimidine 5'-nucleotidase [Azospirillum sp. TSO22-1]|uniref:pyrimidine 5'-nucleotidase n=1 Tax=Azospirillum sp. TSO22-1 TaxID=716789 RepID=UPI000D604369|nr:pyrimidine 5'-nucleotidase [Azospirillum sp. TSO22-1]PWC43524.1 HAD family hydrolase [Azospirillum sp. TSO22-1]